MVILSQKYQIYYNKKVFFCLQQESTYIGLYYLFCHFSVKCWNRTPVFNVYYTGLGIRGFAIRGNFVERNPRE
jgi:hypothetical protein